MELGELYTALRTRMMGIAYHMLGTISEAEDVVQDVFATLQGMDTCHIEHEQAYVIQMLVNRCRNHLGAAARKREVYIGPWLPEPLVERHCAATSYDRDPLHVMERGESVSYAMMVLFERLSPLERTVFVLREVFSYDYSEIASMIDKSVANCRKIFSRATKHLQFRVGHNVVTDARHLVVAEKFMHGISTGDFGDFIQSLGEEVQMISDGGGKTKAAIYPVYGLSRVVRLLQGLYRKGTFKGQHLLVKVNGQPGVLLFSKHEVYGIISFDYGAEHVTRIYIVINPEKLSRLRNTYCIDCCPFKASRQSLIFKH